jgi:hypothetical protein
MKKNHNFLQINISNESYDSFIDNYCNTNKIYLVFNENFKFNIVFFQYHNKSDDIDFSILTYKFKYANTNSYNLFSILFSEIKNNVFINLTNNDGKIYIFLYYKIANISKILNYIHDYPTIEIEDLSKIKEKIQIISNDELKKNKQLIIKYFQKYNKKLINKELSKNECHIIARQIIINQMNFNCRKLIEIGYSKPTKTKYY